MCGIAGIISSRNLELQPIAGRMLACLSHRGPDGNGEQELSDGSSRFALSHARLAILDLSPAGAQPMRDSRTGNVIVFNGEIYNFPDLRNELDGPWMSNSDTEVILRGYEKWGTALFGRLRGMFALGLYDRQAKKFVLARDEVGIKPLYYFHRDGVFAFASEVRALLACQILPRKISRAGIESYLRFGSVQEPLTLVEGIFTLPPGHCMSVSLSNNSLEFIEEPYAKKHCQPPKFSDRNEAVGAVRAALEGSVKAHLISDVPVGAFLSGGIDSSAIVALMSRVSNSAPRTFTVIFEEREFTEREYAKQIADEFKTIHTEILLRESDLLSMLPQALSAMDQPTMDGVNTYVVSQAVRETGLKVALSGLGGDELFAGYPSFRRAVTIQRLARVPSVFRNAAAGLARVVLPDSVSNRKVSRFLHDARTPWDAYRITRELFADQEISELLGHELAPSSHLASEPSDWINEVSGYEMHGYMTSTLLRDTDQMSMAHGLEVRVPFIDSQVIPLVQSLPGAWKMNGSSSKPLLVEALGELLPTALTDRPKMGFTFPFSRWMQSRLKTELESTFNPAEKLEATGLKKAATEHWRKFCQQPQHEKWSRPWALYVLIRWCSLNGVTC